MNFANDRTTFPQSSPARILYSLVLAVCFLPAPHAFSSKAINNPNDYSQAEALVRDHQWDKGLALLEPMLKDDPKNVKTLNLAGLAFTGKGDLKHANEYFQKALEVNPGFVPALKNLGFNEFHAKDFVAAEQHLLIAEKESPGDPVINLYLGELSYAKGRYRDAADLLPRAGGFLFRDPNVAGHLAVSYLKVGEKEKAIDTLDSQDLSHLSPQSQLAVGVALAEVDLPDRAITYLQAVRQRYPDSYDIGFDLALCYLSLNQYSKTIEVLHDLIDKGQETAELNNVLAEAYERKNETQHAIDALRRATSLAPENEDNYLDFAALCMNHQDFDAGLQILDVGIRFHPKSDRLLFERGVLHAMQDNFQLAEKDFQQVAILSPKKNSSYTGLGVLYLEAGDAAQAIQILRKRLHDDRDDPNLLYLLGEALMRAGAHPGDASYSEAQASFEKSVTLNPRLCPAHVSLGKIYLEEDRTNDAIKQLEQAKAIDPKEKSAYWQLAVAYRRLGQTEKQKEVLNSLKEINEQERNAPRDRMRAAEEGARGDALSGKN